MNEPDGRLILSHCYCELAEQALAFGDLRRTRNELDQAIQADAKCTRAQLLLIDVHLKNNHLSKASRLFEQLLQSDKHQIELLLPAAREILLQRGSIQKYQDFLRKQYEKTPISPVAVELLDSYLANEQHEQVLDFIKRVLKESATLEIFEFAMRYFKAYPQYLDDNWPDLTKQFKEIRNKRIAYSCNVCGYGSNSMFWTCPSCQSWSSMKPVH